MHQAYVKTICKEKLTYTATLPKIAASTTVDCQDRIQPLLAGGVRMSQRGRHWGSLCTLAAGGGGGPYTVAEDWTTERGVGRVDHIFFALTPKL